MSKKNKKENKNKTKNGKNTKTQDDMKSSNENSQQTIDTSTIPTALSTSSNPNEDTIYGLQEMQSSQTDLDSGVNLDVNSDNVSTSPVVENVKEEQQERSSTPLDQLFFRQEESEDKGLRGRFSALNLVPSQETTDVSTPQPTSDFNVCFGAAAQLALITQSKSGVTHETHGSLKSTTDSFMSGSSATFRLSPTVANSVGSRSVNDNDVKNPFSDNFDDNDTSWNLEPIKEANSQRNSSITGSFFPQNETPERDNQQLPDLNEKCWKKLTTPGVMQQLDVSTDHGTSFDERNYYLGNSSYKSHDNQLTLLSPASKTDENEQCTSKQEPIIKMNSLQKTENLRYQPFRQIQSYKTYEQLFSEVISFLLVFIIMICTIALSISIIGVIGYLTGLFLYNSFLKLKTYLRRKKSERKKKDNIPNKKKKSEEQEISEDIYNL